MAFLGILHRRHHQLFLIRMVRNGFYNLWRSKTLAVATVLIIALMLFVFNIVLALSLASDSVLLSIGQKIDIRAEFQPGVEEYSKKSFIQELKNRPQVAEVIFTGRDDALRKLGSKYPNIIAFLDQNQLDNPLPDTLRIVTRRLEDQPNVYDYLKKPEFSRLIAQEKLTSDTEQTSRQEKILNITQFLKRMGTWLNLTFAVVAVLIIFNTISLNIHSATKEISVMQLVGAKLGFIRGGYLCEGLFYAVGAVLISLMLSRLTVIYLSRNLLGVITSETLLQGLNAIVLHFGDLFFYTLVWELFAAMAVGLLSSFLAIEIYLRKKHYF